MKKTPLKRQPMKRKSAKRKPAKSAVGKPTTTSTPTSSTVPTDLLIALGKASVFVPATITSDTIEAMRDDIRRGMAKARQQGRLYRCDCCGQLVSALDMHEIINRGRTQAGSLTRLISYQPELTTMICRSCHENAHTPAVREKLFRFNYEWYGEHRVRSMFELLLRSTKSGYIEGITLP